MSEVSWMERNGLTPAKLAGIGLLAVVFLVVAVVQLGPVFFPPHVEPKLGKRAAARARANRRRRAATAATAAAKPATPRRAAPPAAPAHTWPELSLKETLDYGSPFALPSEMQAATDAQLAAPPPAAATPGQPLEPDEIRRRSQDRLAFVKQLQRRGVDVVLVGRGVAVATIGSMELREGDLLEGFRVQRITSAGIELVEENPLPAGQSAQPASEPAARP